MYHNMRETTTLTVGNYTIEHVTYMTTREAFELRKQKGDEEAQTKYICQLLIKSINGSSENIWETLLDMSTQEFQVIQEKLVSLINPSGKSTSPSTTTATNE